MCTGIQRLRSHIAATWRHLKMPKSKKGKFWGFSPPEGDRINPSKRNLAREAKFHYAILLANSSRARSRAGLRPSSELVADLVSDLSQTGSSYLESRYVEIARTWSQLVCGQLAS